MLNNRRAYTELHEKNQKNSLAMNSTSRESSEVGGFRGSDATVRRIHAEGLSKSVKRLSEFPLFFRWLMRSPTICSDIVIQYIPPKG